MNAWLQRHDLSSKDLDLADSRAAITLLRDFDWQSERQSQADGTEDTCDAGLGLVVGDGHILHLCPDGDGKATVHFHYPSRKKWFEVFSGDASTKTWQEIPMEKAEQMVESLFKGDYEALTQ